MNIWKDYLLPVMPVVLVIVGLLAARRQRHLPPTCYGDSRYALCAPDVLQVVLCVLAGTKPP